MGLDCNKKDIIGMKFGRITVISESNKRNKCGHVYWDCICDCGKRKTISGSALRLGKTNSCGCLARETVRKEYGEAAFNKLYASYKRGAKDRGLDFEISKIDFKQLTKANCYYCNSEPKNICSNNGKGNFYGNYIYNGIDRVDNNKGYIERNIVTCCFVCNKMKSIMSHDDFLDKIKQIYLHQNL